MIRIRKKHKYLFFISFILVVNSISVFLLSPNIVNLKPFKDSVGDPNSLPQMSSNGPPNKQFFNYYKTISIDHTKVSGTGSHQNFPVLISLLDSDLKDAQSSGNDIAFANDTAWLDHEIELFDQSYNSTHAELIAWVRIPSLSTSIDTKIYMYYGNSTMSSQQNPNSVWNINYKGVWHLKENPGPGNSGDIKDSTINSNDGTAESSMDSSDQSTGNVNGGIDFDGIDDNINVGSGTSISNLFNGGGTISAWIFPETWGGAEYGRILDKSTATAGDDGWVMCVDGEADLVDHHLLFYRDFNAQRGLWYTPGDSLSLSDWYYVVVTYDDSSKDNTPSIYINGNLQSLTPEPSPQGSPMDDSAQSLYFGDFMGGGRAFNGVIDEVRLSKGMKSSDWIQTEYNNQNDPKSFYSAGRAKSVSGHPPNAHFFTYYKEFIIDHTLVGGSSDLLNFPILISRFDKDLHDDVQLDGDDIAFSDGISWLDYEMELFVQAYNSTHAQLIAWVNIPTLSTSLDTVIRMYYGNSTMGPRENPTDVWNSNYKGIWHLNEDPTDPTPQFLDSTVNNNDGTAVNLHASNQTSGIIDGSLIFNDENEACVEVSDDNSLDLDSDMTISAWVKTTLTPLDTEVIVNKWASNPPNQNFWLGKLNDNDLAFYVDATDNVKANLNLITDNNWHYITGIADSSNSLLKIYVDGIERGSAAYGGSSQTGTQFLNIGKASGEINQEWNGNIDEVRVSNIDHSAGWILTEFNNQYDPKSFYSVGKEFLISGIPPNENYFKYYKEISIDYSMVSGSNDLLNFPALISILDTDLHDNVDQSNGNDIAFAFNGAWLDHEIELFNQAYNSTHAQLIIWVSIPRLSTSEDTIFRMYYGNSTMDSRQNPSEVWGQKFKGVWHLRENPSAASPQMKDSTSNNNDGTCYYLDSGDQKTGQIDGSIEFNDVDANYINCGTGSSLNMGSGDFSLSLWFNYPLGGHNGPIAGKGAYGSGGKRYFLAFESDKIKGEIDDDDVTKMNVYTPSTVDDTSWHYVLLIRDGNYLRLYFDGAEVTGSPVDITGYGSIDMDLPFYMNTLANNPSGTLSDWSNVKMDEVRIANIAHSADWIATEYNNQYNPRSYLAVGSEVSFDLIPPTYSNLIESSDPLEIGETEVITINVTDPSGINQVKIEFEGTNHSMTNIWADAWQYDSWTPSSVDNYTYTIWMEDNYNNWNSTIGIIEVIDSTPPTFSDLIESADQLQLGQNETINIKVYDSPGSGVNQVLLEYDSSNHTMGFIGGNTWSWSKWKPISLGIHPYTIYMQDMEDNWNMTSGTIEVVSTTAPVIENLTKSPETLELGDYMTIFVDVDDNETYVSTVLIELENVNYTMNGPVGTTYNYTWTRSWAGSVLFTIYANDSADNWASYTNSFDIVDTVPPSFSALFESEDPLELGDSIIISINSTDLSEIIQVDIEYQDFDSIIRNHTMSNIIGNLWQYDLWTPHTTGNLSYTIWAKDNNTNIASFSDSIIIQDTTLPSYSDLTESATIVELGDQLTIMINASDLAGIEDVSIEFEGANHSMTYIGSIWQHNTWRPKSIGNYTYKIYITDNNNNINYTSSSILFQDTTIPIYSNYYESIDPLELGDNPIIRIDVYDFAEVNQTLIEFEGANHSMTNIYGETWQYDSWTPTNWIIHQYTIHMEDNSGNWNSFIANITVQDTIAPPPPVLTNSPIGDVSGTLVFDWNEGIDPSGISYFILIIDNEADPLTTPGVLFEYNITNIGPQSSYFEFSENLDVGRYYYFLAQVDGVGQQGSYTVGTFRVISTEISGPDNMNLTIIIIIIILASVIGSVTAIVIVRKRLKKDITPPRKRIPLKLVSTHINKLSRPLLSSQTEELLATPADNMETLTEDEKLEIKINEIKDLGEQLFAEGAYLEAQKQFELGRDLLLNLGRQEDAQLFTELISGIEGLIEERDKRLEFLERIKLEGNPKQVFELYQDIIEISKKLRDPDTTSFYQSELILYFQNNQLNILELERYRFELNHKADSFFNTNMYERAAQLYEKCEKLSVLLVQLEREKEVSIIEDFRYKKNESLKRVNNI